MPQQTLNRRRTRRSLVLCGLLGMAVVSRGGNAETSAPEPTTDESSVVTASDDGCASGFTDLAVLGTDIASTARCEPGFPEPEPLAERATIRVSASSLSWEGALPLLLGLANGEFEREGLDIEIEVLSASDALPLLAQNDLDVMLSSMSAGVFNVMASGFDVRWSMPINYNAPSNLDGLWARGSDVSLEDVADMRIASATGLGSPVAYSMERELQQVGLSWGDLNFEVLPPADIPEALRNGAVDAAVLIDPFWVQFVDEPGYTHLINNMPAGEPLSAVLVSPNLVGERHDVGVAFHRAWIRTVSTYLGPEYKSDAAFCAEAAELLEQDPTAFCSQDGSIFDYEVKAGTASGMQQTFQDLDVLDYDELLPDSQVVDRSFVEEAIGHSYGVD